MAVRILIIDDHTDSAAMAARILRDNLHQCATVGDYDAALDAVLSGRFDVLIADLTLPHGNGMDLPPIAAAAGIQVHAIAMTGLADTATRERCRRAGFHTVLVKPISLDDLIDAVQEAERSMLAARKSLWELDHHPFRVI